MHDGVSRKSRQLQFEVIDVPPEGVVIEDEIAFADIGLPDESRCEYVTPLHYRLHFEAINGENDLLVRGKMHGEARVICDRCEEPFTWEFHVDDFCQVFEKAFGTTIDLTDFIREDILINFPQQFLCKPDCLGLCPHCGQNLNEGDCDCEEEEFETEEESENPWSALDAFKDGKS